MRALERARPRARPGAHATPIAAYLAVLATAALCYASLGSVLRILPSYVPGTLHSGAVGVGLAVGAPALGAIVARPLGGRWADRRGPLRVLLVGAVAMAAVSPLALIASLPGLLLSRVAAGAGEGVMMSAAALWLLRLGGERRRGRSMGHVGLANYLGLVAGPLLAVAIAGETHPQRVFLASSALPLLAALLILALRPRAGGPAGRELGASVRAALRRTLRPGVGLMLVNVGYAALVSFGASAIAANGARAAGLVIPVFAAVVILARGLAGSVPDRFGAERTLLVCCPLTAAGLCGVALATSTALVLVSLVVLAAGQAFAVPALGAIAVRRSPSAQHGATAGLFFAWFDAGVGLGGPVSGLAARLSDASGALLSASFAVALAPLVAGAFAAATLTRPRSRRGAPQRRTSRSSGHSRPQRG